MTASGAKPMGRGPVVSLAAILSGGAVGRDCIQRWRWQENYLTKFNMGEGADLPVTHRGWYLRGQTGFIRGRYRIRYPLELGITRLEGWVR
jgi:hypothetical protein